MDQNTPCALCKRVGAVHLERIITGTTTTLSCYCGACGRSWRPFMPDHGQSVDATLRPQKDRRRMAKPAVAR